MYKSRKISMIVAHDMDLGIGYKGDMQWKISSDLRRFKEITKGNTLIMGRKTFDSLPGILPYRDHIVLSRDEKLILDRARVVHSLDEAIQISDIDKEIFIIGGGEIYAMTLPYVDILHLSIVQVIAKADTYFPELRIAEDWKQLEHEYVSASEKNQYAHDYYKLQRA